VYIEATCAGSATVERHLLGTVGGLSGPVRKTLSQVTGEKVFFTIKVVDSTDQFGRILGLAEQIHPQHKGEKQAAERPGILPIVLKELGPQIWKLEFEESGVVLAVNKQILGFKDRLRTDVKIFAAIFPEIIRRILERAIAENGDPNDPEDVWPNTWLRFAMDFAPITKCPSKSDLENDREDWIEEVVDLFCQAHDLKAKIANALNETGGDS
jgi:hypothetical protein